MLVMDWVETLPNPAPNEKKKRNLFPVYIPWWGIACHKTVNGEGEIAQLRKQK